MAATAKDCSVMMTIMPIPKSDTNDNGGMSIVEVDNCVYNYIYRLSVVDLDPKSAENIPPYYSLDQKIVDHFLQNSVQKTCK